MFEWLGYPVAFIIALSIVVAVHEFGHFWVARKIGVHVIRFAVGFGPVIKSMKDRYGTEFCLCAIPLGGYVRLLDERQDEISPGYEHQEFSKKSVYGRIAVYAAGPLINILLAVVIFWLYALIGVESMKPMVVPNTSQVETAVGQSLSGPAHSDELVLEIKSINNKFIQSFNDLNQTLIHHAGFTGPIQVTALQINPKSLEPISPTPIAFNVPVSDFLHDSMNPIAEFGFDLYRESIEPVLGKIIADGPAEVEGWKVGDLITALDGQKITTWNQVVPIIQANPGQMLDYEIIRQGEVIRGQISPMLSKNQAGEVIGLIGAGIADVEPNPKLFTKTYYSIFSAIPFAIQETFEKIYLVVVSIGKLIFGDLSLKTVSGPVTIAEVAGKSFQIGLSSFLSFLAYLSISLGVINSFPLPMLDGGHILYALIEIVRGRPLSVRIQQFGQGIGFVMLMGLMMLAFYNDFSRLLL